MQRDLPPPSRPPWLRRARDWLMSPLGTAVCVIGVSQIIAWGTTLYCLGAIATPVIAETGWSRGLVFGGLTAGLLVSGAISAPMGRMTDRYGARAIMCIGALIAAAGLAALSQVRDEFSWLAVWAVIGIAMRMFLYDVAFAAMVQVAPTNGRRAISYLTLFGGFASSVFWPLGHWLVGEIGWRDTVLIFALVNLLLTLPLNWLGLARREPENMTGAAQTSQTGGKAAVTAPAPLTGRDRLTAMILFATVMSGSAFIFGAMAVHLPGVLQATGLATASAMALASFKGFAQVGGRVWEILFAKHLSPITVGRVAILCLPLSFAILLAGGSSFANALLFTTVFGIANGLVTIVRGAVPLQLFGPEGYGTILGILATPYLILNAISPLAFALIIDWGGYRSGEALMLVVSALSLIAMEVLSTWHRRRSRQVPS